MSMTSLWSIGISLSIDSSRRSESLLSPHRFLSWVLINFSSENDRSTERHQRTTPTEAGVTGIVAYYFRSKVRPGKTDSTSCLLGTLAHLSHCWGEEHMMSGIPWVRWQHFLPPHHKVGTHFWKIGQLCHLSCLSSDLGDGKAVKPWNN